jgi:hypothetical protein
MVFRANVLIDRAGVWKPVTAIETAHQKQYIAEAKFLRAYAYFNLVSLYGRVPLRTSYAQTTNNLEQPRAAVAEIWTFVETDLREAQAELPVAFANADLGRATKGAATALLGKAYLYQKKYALAVTELTKLTQAPYTYTLSPNYSDLFNTTNQNNKENIFQIMNQTWTDWGIGSQYYVFGGQEINGIQTVHRNTVLMIGAMCLSPQPLLKPSPTLTPRPAPLMSTHVLPTLFMVMQQAADKHNIASNVRAGQLLIRLQLKVITI